MSQKIRIKLKSYDYNLVDKSAEKIVKTVKTTGAVVSGPIPLPTHKRIYTVLRSPHVNKKAREQFELCSYKRLLDIYSSSSKTVDALMRLELPSGVDVEIKVQLIIIKRMPGLIGRKVGMTSIYSVEGKATPCTVIEAGPCVVTQVKTSDRDGYDAIQLGFGERKEKNTPNALLGHFKKVKTTPKSNLVEFDGFEQELKAGEVVDASLFAEGDRKSVV